MNTPPSRARFAAAALLTLVLAALGALAPAAPATAAGPTLIDSDVAASTTWALAGSPYLVTKPIKVLAAATLVIEAGVQVQFLQDTGMQIDGGLLARGIRTQPISFAASGGGIQWQGLSAPHPASKITIQNAIIRNARAGILIQPAAPSVPGAASVEVSESLIDTNLIGVSVDYAVATGAPHLTLRNNLITSNSVGVQASGLASGSSLFNLSYNSFVLNGIAVKALNITGPGLTAKHQWWNSASGPAAGDPTYCSNDPPPNPIAAPPEIVCGAVDFTSWTIVPAGRSILQVGKTSSLVSAIGVAALGENPLAATSVVTVTIPANTLTVTPTYELVVAPRQYPDPLVGTPTALDFEISAVASGQELQQFAAGKQISVQIAYTDADLNGADEQKLLLYRFDNSLLLWSFVGSTATPSPASNRVTATLDHFGRIRVTSFEVIKYWLPILSTQSSSL
jgi:hypothetical protein